MRAFLLAVALIATPASAKIWADDACAIVVSSDEAEMFVVTRDTQAGVIKTTCKIESWPIASPIAILSCDDGSKPEMQLVDGGSTMAFEDAILRVPTDDNGVCD